MFSGRSHGQRHNNNDDEGITAGVMWRGDGEEEVWVRMVWLRRLMRRKEEERQKEEDLHLCKTFERNSSIGIACDACVWEGRGEKGFGSSEVGGVWGRLTAIVLVADAGQKKKRKKQKRIDIKIKRLDEMKT